MDCEGHIKDVPRAPMHEVSDAGVFGCDEPALELEGEPVGSAKA